MLRNYLAKRKTRKFLTEMPQKLASDYGKAHEYSTGQVKTAANSLGYNSNDLIDVAIAIYCNKEAARAFGMDEALIKKYRGYPQQHRVTLEQAAGLNAQQHTLLGPPLRCSLCGLTLRYHKTINAASAP